MWLWFEGTSRLQAKAMVNAFRPYGRSKSFLTKTSRPMAMQTPYEMPAFLGKVHYDFTYDH